MATMGIKGKPSATSPGRAAYGPADLQFDRLLGARVREFRKSEGLSQQKCAAMLGITFQQLQKYEAGVNRISVSRLVRISQALDVPIEEFLRGLCR